MDKSEKIFHETKYSEGEDFDVKYKNNFIWRNHWLRIMNYVKNNQFEGSYILNIGSGPGAIEFFLRKTKNYIFSADISYNALGNIKILNLNNCLINCDILKLPFKNKVFDSIIALNVLHHTSNFKMSITELLRVAKANAFFVSLEPVETPARQFIKTIFRKQWDKVHSVNEKELLAEHLKYIKNQRNVSTVSINPFNPLLPLVHRKLGVVFVAMDSLLELLGVGWLYFISFKITQK
jgi:ubiquinone/menaquinone biosynthesis C-methylase UbiE